MKELRTTNRHRQLAAALGATLLLGTLAACSATETEQPVRDLGQEQVQAGWTSKDKLLSEAHVDEAESIVLAYTLDGKTPYLVARDLATGEEIWKEKSGVGNTPSGIAFEVSVVENNGKKYVSLLQLVEKDKVRPAVLDLKTGQRVSKDPGYLYNIDRPTECDNSWCTIAASPDTGGNIADYYYDWHSNSWKKAKKASEMPDPKKNLGDYYLGEGLSISSDQESGRSVLSYAHEGALAWSKDYEEIYDEHYSTGGGWAWETFDGEQSTLVGSGNRTFYQFELGGRDFEWDMATDSMLVGLDPQTGDGRWSLPGADYSCLGILDLYGVHTDSTLMTCQINSGTAEVNVQDDGTAKLGGIKNFEGNFVGIDVHSGKKKWSFPMPDMADNELVKKLRLQQQFLAGDKSVVLPLAEGAQVVDIDSGKAVGIEQGLGQPVLCTMELEGVDVQRSGNDKDTANLLPATTVQSCDRDTRKKSDQLPLFAEFQRAGYQEGATVVLEGEKGLTAYTMPSAADPAPESVDK